MKIRCFHVLLILIASIALPAQSLGLGYSSNKSLLLDCTWVREKTAYQIGIAVQRSDAVGKKIDERKPNYGLEQTGTGNSYASLDFGVGFRLSKSSKIIFIGTAGQREFFTNFSDLRFNGGGYHMVDKTEFVGGGGISFHFGLTDKMGMELAYNSLHGAVATFQFLF